MFFVVEDLFIFYHFSSAWEIAGKDFRNERSPFLEFSKPVGHSYYRFDFSFDDSAFF